MRVAHVHRPGRECATRDADLCVLEEPFAEFLALSDNASGTSSANAANGATRRPSAAPFMASVIFDLEFMTLSLYWLDYAVRSRVADCGSTTSRPVHTQNIIRLRTMSLGHYRIALSSWRDGSFDGFLQCGRGSASALTSCWNLLSCAISSRCCSEQAHGVHASARVSDCSGCCCRAGGQIGSAV